MQSLKTSEIYCVSHIAFHVCHKKPSHDMLNNIVIDTSSRNWWHPTENRFFIHDNGGRPFLVQIVSPTQVEIYCENEVKEEENKATYLHIHTFNNLKRILIPNGELDGEFIEKYKGNNILLEISDTDEYILISCQISKFRAKSRIVRFFSPMGNNNVPYPIAVDENNRYYILWDDIVLESIPVESQNDPTMYWVDEHRIRDGMRIGSEEWYFSINIDPGSDHAEWLRIQRQNGEITEENERHRNIYRVLMERRNNQGERERSGPEIAFLGYNEENEEPISFSMEEYGIVEEMFPEVERDPMSYPVEDVFVKNPNTKEWDLIDFERYQQLQNEWRARLRCSSLLMDIMTPRQ